MRVLRFSGSAVVCSLLVAAVVAGAWYALTFAARDVGGPGPSPDAAVSLPPAATVAPMPSPPRTPAPTSTPTAPTSSNRSPNASASASSDSSNRFMFQSGYGDAVVHCTGTQVVYVAVRPESGWVAATQPISPSVLQITFIEPGRRVLTVRATCRAGVPHFDPPAASATPSPSP